MSLSPHLCMGSLAQDGSRLHIIAMPGSEQSAHTAGPHIATLLDVARPLQQPALPSLMRCAAGGHAEHANMSGQLGWPAPWFAGLDCPQLPLPGGAAVCGSTAAHAAQQPGKPLPWQMHAPHPGIQLTNQGVLLPACLQSRAVNVLLHIVHSFQGWANLPLPHSTKLRIAAALADGGVLDSMHNMAVQLLQLGQAAHREVQTEATTQASCTASHA